MTWLPGVVLLLCGVLLAQDPPSSPAPESAGRRVADSVLLTTPYSEDSTVLAVDSTAEVIVYDTVDLSERAVVLSVDDGYHSVFTNIYPLLKRYRIPITLGVITDYVGPGRPSYQPSAGFMNQAEVRELVDSCGIEVASHSMSHPYLTRIDSAAAWREIHESRVILESLFDTEVITFVYPYGDMDARVRRMVKQAGYRVGRAVRPGTPNFWSDPYRIPIVELRLEARLGDIKSSIRRRKTTVLLIHQVVDRPEVFTEWPAALFAELIDWLDRGGARVTTLAQLYREWWIQELLQYMEELAAAYPDGPKQLLFEEVDVDATQTAHPGRGESLDILP